MWNAETAEGFGEGRSITDGTTDIPEIVIVADEGYEASVTGESLVEPFGEKAMDAILSASDEQQLDGNTEHAAVDEPQMIVPLEEAPLPPSDAKQPPILPPPPTAVGFVGEGDKPEKAESSRETAEPSDGTDTDLTTAGQPEFIGDGEQSIAVRPASQVDSEVADNNTSILEHPSDESNPTSFLEKGEQLETSYGPNSQSEETDHQARQEVEEIPRPHISPERVLPPVHAGTPLNRPVEIGVSQIDLPSNRHSPGTVGVMSGVEVPADNESPIKMHFLELVQGHHYQLLGHLGTDLPYYPNNIDLGNDRHLTVGAHHAISDENYAILFTYFEGDYTLGDAQNITNTIVKGLTPDMFARLPADSGKAPILYLYMSLGMKETIVRKVPLIDLDDFDIANPNHTF